MKLNQEGEELTTQAHVLSVSELNKAIKDCLEGSFTHFWLKAEVSNFTAHASGHWYFSLKDKRCQVSAVMFRGNNSGLKFRPEMGMEVIIRGRVSVYEPQGRYQIFCEFMEPAGVGALQQAFEQLKLKLQKEGLFDPAHKKVIPSFPQHIAVVTSPTGAAVKDILNVLSRRYRSAEVTIIPTVVQGDKAAVQIVNAIKLAEKLPHVDVLIVGRGGGSKEDLWCFNDEALARAIYACPIPVISAVGHEIDYTICDFVADLRAPTPSAAAELVAKNAQELQVRLRQDEKRLIHLILAVLREAQTHLKNLDLRLTDPRKRLEDLALRCDELTLRLKNSILFQCSKKSSKIEILKQRLVNPKTLIEKLQQRRVYLQNQLKDCALKIIQKKRYKWEVQTQLLDSFSPLKVVDRGYAILKSKDVVIKKISQVKKGDRLEARVRDGYIISEVLITKNFNKKEETKYGI